MNLNNQNFLPRYLRKIHFIGNATPEIGEAGAIPIFVLLVAIGIVAFVAITNSFDFRSNIFDTLYPKPTSSASVIVNPTINAIIYQEPKNTSGSVLPVSEIVSKFHVLVYHRGFESGGNNKLANYRSNGWTGPALEYVVLDEWEGPSGLATVASQTTPCNSTQLSFTGGSNQINFEQGDFCRIHDSIIEGQKTTPDPAKKIDLNMDGVKDVFATEDWFVHNSDNTRKYYVQNSTDWLYRPNPKNVDLKKYFIGRLIREMKGGISVNGSTWASTNTDGVYLDNLGLGWSNLTNSSLNVNCPSTGCNPKEFSSSTDYADSIFAFVQQIHEDPGYKALNKSLFGNMISGSDNGTQWDRFDPYLEGGLMENFVLNWGSGPYGQSKIENQLIQAEKWVSAGNHYIAVGRGCEASVTSSTDPKYCASGERDKEAKFTQAAYLLIANGTNASMRYADNGSYATFFDYPELYYQLGAPTNTKYLKSGTTNRVWKRDFVCGFVELDLTANVGIINYTSDCDPLATIPNPDPNTSSTPSSSPTSTGNLVTNPGCEIDTSNWIGYNSAISKNSSVSHSGTSSCQATWNGTGTSFSIDDQSPVVTNPLLNDNYTASAWVRSDTAVGKTIKLNLRQRGGTTADKTDSSTTVTLSTNWQQITASTTINTSDRTLMDIYISQSSPSSGNSFQVDDITVVLGSDGIPSPTPNTSSPTPAPTDTIKPSVSITNPINGARVQKNTNINIQVAATDENSGIAKVEIYQGTTLICTRTITPYECSWKVPGKRNATYKLKAKATDKANNPTESEIIQISTQ